MSPQVLQITFCKSVIQSVIQFAANILQRRPARIFHRPCALALLNIQILAAMRTKTLTVIAADRFQGKSQQYLLLQNIFQLQSLTLIIADLGLGGGDGKLFPPSISSLRAVEQIELVGHILHQRFKAAGTG